MDIGAWLGDLGLERYAPAFQDAEITPAVLPELTEADLKELGLPLGPRKLLLKAISALASGTEPPTAREARRPDAERRQLTVMFCDLVGSTALSARLDPEDMREVIRAYQNAVAGEVTRFEGHVAKFMGDGVLAYFGWPRAHEDDAERAVRAGLAVVEAIGELETPTDEALAARVGIATGLVVVGDLAGEGAAQEQAVVGETPNLAARLQGMAAPNQLVIASTTRRLVGASFALQDLGEQEIKGIGVPVQAFAVAGQRPVESRFEAMSGRSLLPMVGRDQELALLLERWSQAKNGEAQGVLLLGEAGIGKSRISRALLDALAEEPHTRIRYQCSPYHRDSALWPVIQQLGHAAGMTADDPPEAKLDKLEALLTGAGEGTADAAPLIADLLGLDGVARYGTLDITAQAQRAMTLAALVHQLLGLAARQPVLLVLEDAHWIDPTTLELIEHCLDRLSASRVLILLTSRPDQQPDLAAHPHVTRLTLNRLGRAGVEAIVERLGGDRLPAETIDAIVGRTDGVPLFVEELTKAVLESGDATVPSSLHDSLMARLDRIPEVKEVAQIAACIGREFGFSLLAEVANRSAAELEPSLAKLADAEILFRRGTPPETRYFFKHALVRDAAYQSLLKRTRQHYHRQVAELMESKFSEVVTEQPELLAHHYGEAGLTERAIHYWQRAGERANERFAHAEAIGHLSNGLEALATLPDTSERAGQELALRIPLAAALQMSKGHTAPEVGAVYDRARELCRHLGNTPVLAPVFLGLWRFYVTRADIGVAREMSDQLRLLADPEGKPTSRVLAHFTLGWTALVGGDIEVAEAEAAAGFDLYRPEQRCAPAYRIGHDPGTGCAIYAAFARWLLGHPDQARGGVGDAMGLAGVVAHPFSEAHASLWGSIIAQLLADPQTVEERAAATAAIATEQQYALWAAGADVMRGWALAARGQGAEGLERMRRGVVEWQVCGARLLLPYFLGLMADIQHALGQNENATTMLGEALHRVAGTGERWFEAELHRLKGAFLLAQSPAAVGEAESSLRQALAIARQQGARSLELRAAHDLARLWAEQGERQKALELLAPVYGWFTEGFDTPDLKHAKALLDELA